MLVKKINKNITISSNKKTPWAKIQGVKTLIAYTSSLICLELPDTLIELFDTSEKLTKS